MSKHKGIKLRHKKGCERQPCTCKPSYRPTVYDRHAGRRIEGPTFRTLAEAKQWRTLKAADVERGKTIMVGSRMLRSVAEDFIDGIERGRILNRSGVAFKPSVCRGYAGDLHRYVLPDLGARQIGSLRRADFQKLVGRLTEAGLSGSRVRNVVNSARSCLNFAVDQGEIEATPLVGLRLPAVREKRRERIADPADARSLLAATPDDDRPIWAVAFYAGLGRGELMALRWEDVDLDAGAINVRHSWDERVGPVAPETERSRRSVPIVGELRTRLLERRLRCEWTEGLMLGRTRGQPFNDRGVVARARRAWAQAGLGPIGLHGWLRCREAPPPGQPLPLTSLHHRG